MTEKSLNFCLLAYVILVTLILAECRENLGRQFTCWPESLKYENFKVDIKFSSRAKRNQILTPTSEFGHNGIDFDPRRRTAIVIHGFLAFTQDEYINDLVEKLLKWQDINVIVVDWRRGSYNVLLYHQAAANTEYVAIQVKEFISQLVKIWESKNVRINDWGPLHFIGFSLGAHVAGYAAHLLKVEDNLLVSRVTGLDPAEPCFENSNNPIRLSRGNARFVDVVHTDAAQYRNDAFGLFVPLGHVDFYVNGGSRQPGCTLSFKRSNKVNFQLGSRHLNYLAVVVHVLNKGVCSHFRALILFILSVGQTDQRQCTFWAHPWNINRSPETFDSHQQTCNNTTCPEMGINAELYNYGETRTFYVPTTDRLPFCNVN